MTHSQPTTSSSKKPKKPLQFRVTVDNSEAESEEDTISFGKLLRNKVCSICKRKFVQSLHRDRHVQLCHREHDSEEMDSDQDEENDQGPKDPTLPSIVEQVNELETKKALSESTDNVAATHVETNLEKTTVFSRIRQRFSPDDDEENDQVPKEPALPPIVEQSNKPETKKALSESNEHITALSESNEHVTAISKSNEHVAAISEETNLEKLNRFSRIRQPTSPDDVLKKPTIPRNCEKENGSETIKVFPKTPKKVATFPMEPNSQRKSPRLLQRRISKS